VRPTVLIGHRGAGKTSLLSRYAGLGFSTLDLDREIENRTGRRVSEIFQNDGEDAFRKIERETFASLPVQGIVAVGAGFPVDQIGNEWHTIWVRRATDEAGRIFTDRPRLDSSLSALDEFHHRARVREPRYAARADAVLILDEGVEDANDPAERAYLLDQVNLEGATLTITKFPRDLARWLAPRLRWKLKFFELRDDLLSDDEIDEALRVIPSENVLISYRRKSSKIRENYACDWALELGPPPFEPTYLSLHHGKLEDLHHPRAHLKAALLTETFEDLMRGHRWQMEDPSRRVFLPMSPDGRWSWYRNLRRDYSLNFIRESEGSASDQPTLLQWLRKPTARTFAAVLGDPVKHSRTPMEQREFFAKKGIPVFAIRVPETEWQSAIDALTELGLTHAAVTAPLKHKAAELIGSPKPINTLYFPNMNVNVNMNVKRKTFPHGTNTDLTGLRKAAALLPPTNSQAVWGGGGTLDVIKQVFPNAELVSVRTGLIRGTNAKPTSPELVIWAASLKSLENPPSDWAPEIVFDLNYSEASPARDYAMKVGAKYISGLVMFRAQAQAQREFWSKF